MSIDNLFQKFAPHSTQHQHTIKFRPPSLQILLSILRQKATVACSSATFSFFKKCSQLSKTVPDLTYTCFAAAAVY